MTTTTIGQVRPIQKFDTNVRRVTRVTMIRPIVMPPMCQIVAFLLLPTDRLFATGEGQSSTPSSFFSVILEEVSISLEGVSPHKPPPLSISTMSSPSVQLSCRLCHLFGPLWSRCDPLGSVLGLFGTSTTPALTARYPTCPSCRRF